MTIGNGVTSIGNYAFDGCSGLTSVCVSPGDAEWVKWLMRGSGFNVDRVAFIEDGHFDGGNAEAESGGGSGGGGTPLPTTFTVTFDANGGTMAEASRTVTNACAVGELPTPTRTGYDFDGWFTAKEGGNLVPATTIADGDALLYAHWSPIRYAVTYELNGGNNAADNPATYTIEEEVVLRAPTRPGYTFKGWTPDGGKIVQGSTGDKTFTATWTQNVTPAPAPGTITVTAEATAAGRVMRLVFHRTGGSDGKIAVKVKTQTSTGICGTDFAYVKEVLVWEDGDASDKVIEVPTYGSGAGKQLRVKLATLTTGTYAGCVTPKLAESKVYAEMTTPKPGTITVTAPDPLSVTAVDVLRITFRRTGGSDGNIAVKS